MLTLVIYDITNDAIRTKIAHTCKGYGLTRVQKSAFLGELNRNMREKLEIDIKRILGQEVGNVQFYPLCEMCYRLRRYVGENYEIKDEDVILI